MITTMLTGITSKRPTLDEAKLVAETLRHYEVLSAERITLDENTGEEKQYVRLTFKEEYLDFGELTRTLQKDGWFIAYLEKPKVRGDWASNHYDITIMVRRINAYTGVTYRGDNPV